MDENTHNKLDKVAEDIVDIKVNVASINAILGGQKESLDFHIHRTNTLEDWVMKGQWIFLLKLLATAGTIVATCLGIYKLL